MADSAVDVIAFVSFTLLTTLANDAGSLMFDGNHALSIPEFSNITPQPR